MVNNEGLFHMLLNFTVNTGLTNGEDFWITLSYGQKSDNYFIVCHRPSEAQEDNDEWEVRSLTEAIKIFDREARNLQNRYLGSV